MKVFLGDAIYAQVDEIDGTLVLTTEDDKGLDDVPSNIIHFGSFELEALLKFIKEHYRIE